MCSLTEEKLQQYTEIWSGTGINPQPTIYYSPCCDLKAGVTCLHDVKLFPSIKDAAAWLVCKRLITEKQMWGVIEEAEAEAAHVDDLYEMLLTEINNVFRSMKPKLHNTDRTNNKQ